MSPNNLNADEIITQRNKRAFIQWGGPYPTNPAAYAGQDAQYMSIDSASISEVGGVEPIWVPDPRLPGRYRLVGRTVTPADLPTATLVMRERHKLIPRQLTRLDCPFNIYEVTGNCKALDSFTRGWTDYVLIYSMGIVTSKDLGARMQWDADEAVEDSLDITLANIYPVGALTFTQEASAEVTREVIDIVYGSTVECGNCGPQNDGTKLIYAVTKSSGAGSPGMPAEVIYTTDGGVTWNQVNITGFGATEDPVAIDIVGDYLVVIGDDALYWAEINQGTGAPGTWTKVTTGFVAAGSPRDIFVLSGREVWICGDGGYVYMSNDITAGVTAVLDGSTYTEDLKRIHGLDGTIVTVGASGQVLYSLNRGLTWTAVDAAPAATTLQALDVKSEKFWWVGGSNGRIYYTMNAGASWTEQTVAGSGVGEIHDIISATPEVMYISRSDATPTAYLLTSLNGGRDWSTGAPRVIGFPVFNRGNRLAFPNVDPSIAANNLAIAGLAGGGVDGILLIGIAARL